MSTGKENEKKKAAVLKIVSGKQPLHDSTSAILNRPPVEPEPSQSTLEATIDEDAVPDPPATRTDKNQSPLRLLCREDTDKSPPSSPGYLDDLFEKLTDSETLGEKLNRVLDNQKALFSIMSGFMGDLAQLKSDVAQISRDVAQIARTQGSGIGFSAVRGQGRTPDLSLVSGVGFSAGRGQGGNGQQESTPAVRGQGGIGGQQESTPAGRGQGGISQQESTPAGRGQGGISQQESTPGGRGQGGISQQESTPGGRELDVISQQDNTPAVRGQGGINLERTPDLSLGSGIDFSLGSGIRDLSLERELEPFDSSCHEHNQSQSGNDNLQSNGREGEDVFLWEAMKIKSGSCSVGNFAVRLVQKIFLQEELVNRNCRGSRGKEGLNPSKLATVKDYTFKLYPTPPGLKDQQWGKCVIAIDEFLRRRKRKDAAAERQA